MKRSVRYTMRSLPTTSIATNSGSIIYSLYIPIIVRGVALILALLIIPCEFIFRYRLSDSEDSILHYIQESRSDSLDSFFKFVVFTGSQSIIVIILPILFNILDPVVTFKICIVSCHLLYLQSFLALIQTDPRPYWVHTNIRGINCENGYGSPSEETLFSLVFYLYIIIEIFEKKRSNIRYFLYFIASIWISLIGYSEIYLGENFLHQIIFTMSIGYIYLTIALSLDVYISQIALVSSYYDNKNRKSKVYWFISCTAMLLVLIAIMINVETNMNISIIWIKNAYKECKFSHDISCAYSFDQSSWIFYNLGAVIGAQFTSEKLPLGWWRTSWLKKIARSGISAGISYGIYYGFNSIPTYDNTTQFVFNYVINTFLCAIISFGALPLIFEKIKLNSTVRQFSETFASGISLNEFE
ncbi:hypothetical protein SteCoe_26210 [Stentor coeruleus]|uniref:Phosphatidic acid phosphatase type 2/haloperoxidase domain-containing protein n=1 Tax=Stentor coeruleus TaxID=5963 RepID=A0A1R2BDF5_9CILI|nr:hypothetical protein SteCoe_26210 [Stentor coeruleus]